MKDVTFLLPAYNEEKSIGDLLEDLKRFYPQSRILVVDNNSTDATSEIAKKAGADVIFEEKQGKAHAVKAGFQNIDSEFVIMMDADNTYDPADAKKLIDHLLKTKSDLVMGSRLKGNSEAGAISKLNTLGNFILSLTVSIFYSKISDLCTGYWAFKREVVDYLLKVGIDSTNFELEAEMFIKVSKGNFKISEVPITYRCRGDESKLNSLKDGWKIFKTLWVYKIRP